MLSPPRLNRQALAQLDKYVLPGFWTEPRIGIVHLGLGNFHRAHQALSTERAMISAGGDWGIAGVTLQGDTSKRDTLKQQDHLYCVIERSRHKEELLVLRVLQEVLALPQDLERLRQRLSGDDVKIISLTVTEKGYCRGRNSSVDLSHPGIMHDLMHPDSPTTAPGIVLWGLRMRREESRVPFTVLSCDNIPHNGNTLRHIILSLASKIE